MYIIRYSQVFNWDLYLFEYKLSWYAPLNCYISIYLYLYSYDICIPYSYLIHFAATYYRSQIIIKLMIVKICTVVKFEIINYQQVPILVRV